MIETLFNKWELETWANVLEIVGFSFTVMSFIIALFVKAEITKLKQNYIFDQRIKSHIKKLGVTTSKLSEWFNDYNNNIEQIQTELRISIAELRDVRTKLGFWDSLKPLFLIWKMRRRLNRTFAPKLKVDATLRNYVAKYFYKLYKTTYEDVYVIYSKIHEVIRQLENIKKNKTKQL